MILTRSIFRQIGFFCVIVILRSTFSTSHRLTSVTDKITTLCNSCRDYRSSDHSSVQFCGLLCSILDQAFVVPASSCFELSHQAGL